MTYCMVVLWLVSLFIFVDCVSGTSEEDLFALFPKNLTDEHLEVHGKQEGVVQHAYDRSRACLLGSQPTQLKYQDLTCCAN